jgi:D-sedoheptulose 7-phosphate isomerase
MVVAGATSDRIQEQHIQMVHMLIELIERSLFPENYA